MHKIWVNQLLQKNITQIVQHKKNWVGKAYIDIVCDARHPLYNSNDFVIVT